MKKLALLSAVALVGLAQAANASQVTFTVDNANIAAYNNTTDFVSQPFNPTLNPATTGVVYEVPVMFQLTGLADGQTFGNIALNVTTSGDVNKNTGPGGTVGAVWFGSTANYPFGKGTQNYYDSNSDAGTNTSDGLDVVAYINAGTPTAQRAAMGIGSPFLLGYAYVNVPAGSTGGTVTITPTQFSYMAGGVLTRDNSAQFAGTSVAFNVPEPASLSLLGMGAVGLLARRRRQA